MAQNTNPSALAPARCITPLYHFSSNAPDLIISPQSRILQFDQCVASFSLDEEISDTFRISPPDYLLIQDSLLSLEYFFQDVSSPSGRMRVAELAEDCLASTRELFRVLRLFNPGRLRAGETFILHHREDKKTWN